MNDFCFSCRNPVTRILKHQYPVVICHLDTKAVQSTIINYCLKVSIDGHSEKQDIPKLLLQVSARELHNSMVIFWVAWKRQGTKKIISSLSVLLYLTLFHIKLIRCLHGTSSCVVVSVAYLPKSIIYIYYHGVIFIWEMFKTKPQWIKQKIW